MLNQQAYDQQQGINDQLFQVIFHKKDDDSSKEKKEELGWRERRSQQSEDVEITDVNDNDDKVIFQSQPNKQFFWS